MALPTLARRRSAFEEFARQSAMYRGGDPGAVRERLAPDVVWHVPGESAIAGDHRGRDAVMAYFERRRAMAGGAMAIVAGERLVAGDVVIQLADGEVERDGERLRWRTAGVYRMDGERCGRGLAGPARAGGVRRRLEGARRRAGQGVRVT